MTDTDNTSVFERAYNDAQEVLDRALGAGEDDGAGYGLAGDVALLAQRYAMLRAAVLALATPTDYWHKRVAEIEAADLREDEEVAA